MRDIALATEDELSEAIGKRLIQEIHGDFHINLLLRKGGSGYLRGRFKNFCEIARYQPLLLITDLDRRSCPSELISSWLGAKEKPASLLFRVAVHEAESWLLADHDAIRKLFQRPTLRLPSNTDDLLNPKEYLVRLAKKGPRNVREAMVPEDGSTAVQGLGYNQLLLNAVLPNWNPVRAEQRSDSLRRTRLRLHELASAKWP